MILQISALLWSEAGEICEGGRLRLLPGLRRRLFPSSQDGSMKTFPVVSVVLAERIRINFVARRCSVLDRRLS